MVSIAFSLAAGSAQAASDPVWAKVPAPILFHRGHVAPVRLVDANKAAEGGARPRGPDVLTVANADKHDAQASVPNTAEVMTMGQAELDRNAVPFQDGEANASGPAVDLDEVDGSFV